MKGRLLILDDDPEFTVFVGTVAKASGYEVLEITDSTKFESALTSWSPSHLMVDLQMPTIDGLEALQILARRQSAAKVVLCSAAAREFMEAVDRLGKRYGLNMSGMFEKPLRVTDLKALLEAVRCDSPTPVSLPPNFDRSFFDEVYGTMGRDWIHRGLANLITQIESTFPEQILASADRKQLARRAHVLASYAGILGFSDLSRHCRELEETCNKGGDFSSPLHMAQVASRFACVKARELLAELMEGRGN